MEKIDGPLKRIADAISKENTPTTSSTEPASSTTYRGDPNCPICGGIGFVRRDLPIDHPDFGKVEICSCRSSEVVRATFQRAYRASNLQALEKMTFATFNPRGRHGQGDAMVRSLENAYEQAQKYAHSLNGWLLLIGGYGVGKTHLAAAIAHEAVSLGVPTLFLTVPDLLDWLRYAYDAPDDTFEARFEEIRNIRLLVLDDLGTQNATAWAQEKLYQIFNHRYIHRLPTVVTTNQALEEIEGRIQSRLRDVELVTTVRIEAQDYRQPLEDTTRPRLSALPLYSRMTFGTFHFREKEKGISPEDRANLRKAFEIAYEFAEHPRGWLVLSGDYGCGKTHLAAAIGNYQASMGNPPLFVVVPDLLDHLRSTFSPTSNISYDEVFEEVRSAKLLILDDLGTQSATPWAREKLYQIINHRYIAELPTVITTSSKPDDIDPRIRSRMLDRRLCTWFAIQAPTYLPVEERRTVRGRKPSASG